MAVRPTSISAVQGRGIYRYRSVIECSVVFENTISGHKVDLTFQLSLDNGTNWYNVKMYPSEIYNGRGKLQGQHVALIDVRPTIDGDTGLNDYSGNEAKVRFMGRDRITNFESEWVESQAFELQTFVPQITEMPTVQDFVQPDMAINMTASTRDGNDPSWIRVGLDLAEMNIEPPFHPDNYEEPYGYTVPAHTPNGFFNGYVRVYDEFFNESAISSIGAFSNPTGKLPWMQRDAPRNAQVSLVGAMLHGDYVGIKVEQDGSFTVSRDARLQISAQSPIPVSWKILGTSNIEHKFHVDGNGTEGGEVIDPLNSTTYEVGLYEVDDEPEFLISSTTSQPVVRLTNSREIPEINNTNTDTPAIIHVELTDVAGNKTSASVRTRLNTRIYQTSARPLREPNQEYRPTLRESNDSGGSTVIPQSFVLDSEFSRRWNDIFYPETHSYPTNEMGEFDEAAAILLNQQSNEFFDGVLLENGEVVYDEEARPKTVNWTKNGTKDYPALVSDNITNLKHWVIDNSGSGNFKLSFEWFDLDEGIFGPPYNRLSPYRGDVLTIYDANAPGALKQTINQFGQIELEIDDSTLLEELFSYTGEGANVVNKKTGERVLASAQGEFDTPEIVDRPKLVVVFYSDASGSASGFKIKSGPAEENLWTNYHIDEANGEIWVHKHESIASSRGAADTTAKTLSYDFVDGYVFFDNENPKLEFEVMPQGRVTVDWSYYSEEGLSNTLIASFDDFVAFQESAVFVTGVGESVEQSDKRLTFGVDGRGRLQSGISVDKNRGTVEILDGVLPNRRYFASYSHHTFVRLTDDGYGNLTFNDPVLVADDTPAFPDYTWADVKISNEGEIDLENAKVIFTPRGYDTDNDGNVILDPADLQQGDDIVDQVLNIHRPWDIQRGTREETFRRCAMAFNQNYIWDEFLARSGGDGQTGDSGATRILNFWQERSIGILPARSTGYGRVVWVLGGASGSNYPETSRGLKAWSFEIGGSFFQNTTNQT